MARTLILCPTFDHCDTLFAAVASVRAQSDRDWRMVIICDGSPPRTVEIASACARSDPRIAVDVRPKGARNGEAWRDAAIRAADEPFVCHLGDDDIWHASHLQTMVGMLEVADFACAAMLRQTIPGNRMWRFLNLGTASARAAVRAGTLSPIGINNVGYRRAAYLRLPEGWTPAPTGIGSDVFMWGKFLAPEWVTVASTAEAGTLKFPSVGREALSPVERAVELTAGLATINAPRAMRAIRDAAAPQESLIEHLMRFRDAVHGIEDLHEAYAAASLTLAPPDTAPNVAVGEERLVVPLRPAALRRARLILHGVRAFGCETPAPGALRALRDAAAGERARVERIVRFLGAEDPSVPDRAAPLLARAFSSGAA